MYSFYDNRFVPVMADETGRLPEFVTGAIMRGDTNEESRIPILLRFLRRQEKPQTCAICTIPKYELEYGDIDAWKDVCKSYGGSWMWKILVYPTREVLACKHDFDVCRECISSHISSSILTGGVTTCDQIACLECSRRLTYEEVVHFADSSALERYILRYNRKFPC